MEKGAQVSVNTATNNLSGLYDKYAGMLLGYIYEIVKDLKLAEQHLVLIYDNLPQHFNDLSDDSCNTWCQLQRLAKHHLSGFVNGVKTDELSKADLDAYNARNKFIALMSPEQKQVFCYVYYRGKTTAQLAIQLDKPEDTIRRALKEAFTIIKKTACIAFF